MLRKLLSILLIAVASNSSLASAAEYKIDKAHSRIGFKIKHLAISNVLGNFVDFDGTFEFDPKNISKSETEVDIQVASINTQEKDRDDHLRNDDFFSVKKFPIMKFKSTKVTSVDGKNLKVLGDLTIRDITKPVTLDVVYQGSAKSPYGKVVAAFSATTAINRKDFGLKWNKLLETGGLVVGEDVTVEIDVEGYIDTEEKNKA
jgi:polyisoprenoid-binding protein YceI